jgi:hypothetical protein
MKLPNADKVRVDKMKITEYLLNKLHVIVLMDIWKHRTDAIQK